ncbi:MAG TPA: alpha/beta hydrolase [Tissierellaceae bacterium]|nr:alpha/beta hydrolase [Tissierellaceae bacterium]
MENTIEIDGLKINYIKTGTGEPVLILHGWGASIETIMPIVNTLKEDHTVFALDLPGFGKSQVPEEVFGSFLYADIVKEFMDRLIPGSLALVGHSFGGKLSIILSSKYPERINRVVLIDSAGLIPKRTIKYHIRVKGFKLLKKLYLALVFWEEKDKRLEKLYKRFGSDDYQNSSGVMRKILVRVVNENLKPILRDIKAPTLLIWGEKDEATPLYMGQIMEKEISDSGLVVFEGAGHYSYLDDFNRFSRVMEAFFKSEDQ